ncbi:MAG: glycosyltransferase family 39 protein [Planctomycetes bacterium]|nr:glycosyltransferase family 39 protein [Planctomycetota bacterium]
MERFYKFLGVVCLCILILKLIFLPRNNMVSGDEQMYTAPARYLVELGVPSTEEFKLICHYDKDYYFAGRLLIYSQAIIYSILGYSVFTMKLLPFIWFLLSAFFIYKIVFRLLGRRSAFTAAVLWLLVPTFAYRIIARPEPMQICFMLVSVYVFLISRDIPSNAVLFLTGFISCIGLWIHPTTFFVSAAAVFFLGILNHPFKKFLIIFSGQVAMGLLFLFYFLSVREYFWEQFIEAGLVWMDSEILTKQGGLAYKFTREMDKIGGFFGRAYMIPFDLILVISFVFTVKKHKETYLKFILPLIPGIFFSSLVSAHSAASFFYYQYLIPVLIIIVVLWIFSIQNVLYKTVLISLIALYFVSCQFVITYKRRNVDFERLVKNISSKIVADKVIMAPETYNIVLDSDKFIGVVYYTFWKSIQHKKGILDKYRPLYGDSFADFIRKQNVKYVILDRNNQDCEELEGLIKGMSKLIYEERSEYGMWGNGFVRVYEIM